MGNSIIKATDSGIGANMIMGGVLYFINVPYTK